MDIRNVQTFLEITETMNFTKAAELLGYSQSAVTAQIKQLEAELGSPLFDRLGRSIRLTAAGERFLSYAVQLVQTEQEAMAAMNLDIEPDGTLRIGASSSVADVILSPIIAEFSRKYPKVRSTVKIADYPSMMQDQLRSGELDLIYYMEEDFLVEENVVVYSRLEPIVFIAGVDHPLRKKKHIPLAEILDNTFIISDIEASYCLSFHQAMKRQQISINPTMEIGSVAGIIRIVASGSEISYVPLFAAQEAINRKEVCVLDVDMDVPPIYARLYRHRNRWESPTMKAFMEFFNQKREHVRTQG